MVRTAKSIIDGVIIYAETWLSALQIASAAYLKFLEVLLQELEFCYRDGLILGAECTVRQHIHYQR